MYKYDLVVIGGGSGLNVASAAAERGLKVGLVEKDRLGGTCLNRGCIPSKMLIHSAEVAETIKHADIFGIEVDGFSIDFQKIVSRVNRITDSDSNEIKNGLMQSENPKLFTKKCKFIGEKTLSIGEEETIVSADKILIASGTKPNIPEIKGLQGSGYVTSDDALRLKRQPNVLTFIGGGYIACELAHFYGSLGTSINIIQRGNTLIPYEDEEISQKFTEIFSKKYKVYLGYNTESVSKNNVGGNDSVFHVVAKNSKDKIVELQSDQLIVSAGRRPNSDELDLKKVGVNVNKRGFIKVDEYLETNVKGIFALGDVVGRYQFKHNANNEAQYAFNNILNPDKKTPVDYDVMPHAIFSSPQVAGVGITEQQLKNENKEDGKDYLKSTYPYIQTGMGEALEDRDGFVKFLVGKKDRKILGCHIMGSDASILIHEVLVAMRAGDGTIDSIKKTIHIHPALSEVVARAAEAM